MNSTRHHTRRPARRTAARPHAALLAGIALLAVLAVPAPADAAPDPSIDTAALLAVPAPVCDIVADPSTLTAAVEVAIDGPVRELQGWVEALLSDPQRWGLTEYEYVHLTVGVHPRLASYPLAGGPVIVADSAALEARSKELYGPDSNAFNLSTSRIGLLEQSARAAPAPNARDGFLSSLDSVVTDGTFTAATTVNVATLQAAINDEWKLTDPFPLELDFFIALRVGANIDESDQRGIIVPCTLPEPVDEPDEQPAAPSPQLDVTCTSDVPRAGELLACTLRGAPADFDLLWRASVNPTVAEGVITTGADGTGDFTIAVPADAVGRMLSVEIVDWTRPIPLGVVEGPVPTSVPAGLGQPAALPDTGRWVWAAAVGLIALVGGAALRRSEA